MNAKDWFNHGTETDFGTNNPKIPELEGTDGGNVGGDVISPREGSSDDKRDEPPVIGKQLIYQQYLESKQKQEEEEEMKKTREKDKTRRTEREEFNEKPWQTTSYCNKQNWKFAISSVWQPSLPWCFLHVHVPLRSRWHSSTEGFYPWYHDYFKFTAKEMHHRSFSPIKFNGVFMVHGLLMARQPQ